MFRANRIGTPYFHQFGQTQTTSFSLAQQPFEWPVQPAQAINAAPAADFAFSEIRHDGGAPIAVTAGYKWGLVQQFVITKPQVGNAVGVEIHASIQIKAPASAVIQPFFAKANAAAGTALGAIQSSLNAGYFGEGRQQEALDDTITIRTHNYKEQVVVKNATPSLIAGTYIHGFAIMDAGGAGYSITDFIMNAGVRQLNDQDELEYRDTRR